MNEFFLVTLPGLEDLAHAEVADWFPEVETKIEHGGVTCIAPMATGLAMNLALKTPTRILLRVERFRCRDFPKLFQTIGKLPWQDWIDPTCELKVHASTRLSRLKIKKRIEETAADAFQDYQKENKIKADPKKELDLYIRLQNDDCTLSLDTSGERLHKRGERQHIGEAPLRETIAAAMIQMAMRKTPEAAGQNIELVDPMMGSGTFLLEGASHSETIEKRNFAFNQFKTQPSETPTIKNPRPTFDKLIGYESDAKTITAARTNLKSVTKPLDIYQKDFFAADPLPDTETKRWLFVNPPYGERLKVKEPLLGYYEKLFAAAERVARPDIAYFLLPSKVVKGKFQLPLNWKVIEKRPFNNGGIPVTAFGFARS
jgi:putative N6-adenine-specific DNA methylase